MFVESDRESLFWFGDECLNTSLTSLNVILCLYRPDNKFLIFFLRYLICFLQNNGMYKQASFLLFSSSKFSVQVPFQQETTLVFPSVLLRASLIAQLVKNLLAMQETLVRFLGWEDPLEKG